MSALILAAKLTVLSQIEDKASGMVISCDELGFFSISLQNVSNLKTLFLVNFFYNVSNFTKPLRIVSFICSSYYLILHVK